MRVISRSQLLREGKRISVLAVLQFCLGHVDITPMV
jgi:hypothetical protein